MQGARCFHYEVDAFARDISSFLLRVSSDEDIVRHVTRWRVSWHRPMLGEDS